MLFPAADLPSDLSRVWARVVPRLSGYPSPDACWLYSGTPSQVYPLVSAAGRQLKVHRLAYLVHVGPIPDGLFVCHRCDVPRCCNPAHLFVGTLRDNVADMVSKRRQAFGERAAAAVLSADDVLHIRSSSESARALAGRFGVCVAAVEHAKRGHTWPHLSGAKRQRVWRVLTCDDVRHIRSSSESVTALARRFGCSLAAVSNARSGLTWSGVPGAVARRRHVPLTVDAVRAIRSSSESLNALSRRFGVSVTAVRNARSGRTWCDV